MNILITADWQAEWNNLDICQKAWDQVLELCTKHKVDVLVIAGDLKRQYNPVDIRVVLWWQEAIKRVRSLPQRLDVLINLGNHDRVGQYTDAINWLPLLRRAGAIVYDKPGVYDRSSRQRGDQRIFFLPYSTTTRAKKNAEKLLEHDPDKQKDILIFHHDISEAQYNVQNSKSGSALCYDDLHGIHYRYVIGGHVHYPQKIRKNVYYVGSPFCEDWGEANQHKRFIILKGRDWCSISSTIPGWYDPSLPGFREPNTWRGTRVRIQVSIRKEDSHKYSRLLEKAQRDGERRYIGAHVTVVPRFDERETERSITIRADDSDRIKLKEYIKRSDCRNQDRSLAIKYMLEKLSHFEGGLRTGLKVKFIKTWARNFLPFKELVLDFRQKGINVIQGINLDRGRKSNGSGKTSLTQPLPVSLFGKTFKDQNHDHWTNRWITKESSEAGSLVRNYKDQKIKIVRGRRPPSLRMYVNGKDHSSGMKSNDRDGTQSQIEQAVGFTWQTFANSVYIDRAIANAFLAGTKKQRTDVLSRFQNLDRFAKALDLVKADIKRITGILNDTRSELEYLKGRITESKENLQEAKDNESLELDSLQDRYRGVKRDSRKWAKKTSKIQHKLGRKEKRYQREYDEANKEAFKLEKSLEITSHEFGKAKDELQTWDRLKSNKSCPLCLQDVEEHWVEKRSRSLKDKVRALDIKREFTTDQLVIARKKVHQLDAKCTDVSTRLGKYVDEGKKYLQQIKFYKEQYVELKSTQHSSHSLVGKTEHKLRIYRKRKKKYRIKVKSLKHTLRMCRFAYEAFSRDGIPAFLNRQLCPVLNKAADYYADLFSDKELQLRFVINKGEFVPEIINSKGGESIDDQSAGERALAGLIASFALREVAPSTNILILDEPGEGLDEQTTRQFARALQVLKSKFDSIWITTHNQVLLSELSGERIITVRKKNRIAKVIQGD